MTMVSSWISAELGVEPLTFPQWAENMRTQSMAVFQSVDPDKVARVQELVQEYIQTQDPALMEEAEKLQAEINAGVGAANEASQQGAEQLTIPMTSDAYDQVRYFVAEEKNGHIAKVVIVVPLTGFGRTVIQHAWNLGDYPSAWPVSEEEGNEL
jgi:hypothetical protein